MTVPPLRARGAWLDMMSPHKQRRVVIAIVVLVAAAMVLSVAIPGMGF